MKKIKSFLAYLAVFTLLLAGCSKDDPASLVDDPVAENAVELSFRSVLNDLSNRAISSMSKSHFDAIPTCSDEPAAIAVLQISYEGQAPETTGDIAVDILSDNNGLFTEYSDLLKVPVPNNGSVTVSLDSFMVYDGNSTNELPYGNLIWVAPMESVEGEFDGYVDHALPFTFEVQDGTKPYIDVEVLCFDRRMVNEYGYAFFDLVPGKVYPFCFFANYCPNGRHYVGNYEIDLWYDDGDTRIQLYNNSNPDVNVGGMSADPLCLVVPESPFEDSSVPYLFYTVTPLDWPGSYGDIANTPSEEFGLSWDDVASLLNDDGETAEYLHLFIGCEPPVVPCPGIPRPGDMDGDCVPDNDDECPEEPGPIGNFGCPDDECPGDDPDNDGVFGECDLCPDAPGTFDNFGCPLDDCVSDTDGDGVNDCEDTCPDVVGDPSNEGCPFEDPEETCETAFMYGDTEINSFSNTTRWGWAEFFGNGDDMESYPIFAGAGQNDPANGVQIGSASIMIVDGMVNLEITLDDDVSLTELHVNLSDNEPSGSVAKAPGQYNMNDMVDTGTLSYTFENFTGFGDDFWIIVHAVTCYPEE